MTVMPEKYPLVVAQYVINGHFRRTEHWAIVVLKSRLHAQLFELKGNSDSFCFATSYHTSFERARDLRGGAHVGWISSWDDLSWLTERLKSVPVVKGDRMWDCQNWTVEALRLLKKDGVVFQHVKEDWLRMELRMDLERSETGMDATVEERLFP